MPQTHPSLEYLLVACVAAAVAFLLTPAARQLAIRSKALALPRDRDVHAVATPRMGGVAIFVALALAIYLASRMPSLKLSFQSGPDMSWIVASAGIICALGILDDKYELDSLTKLAGQVLATGLMVIKGGVQLALLPWPNGTLSLGRDLAVPLTILLTLLIINAMNFIDGLDGLAAGVAVIAAAAYFVYSFHLAQRDFTAVSAPPLLLSAVLAGGCAGFLPHNFWPARVFMGDSGSMVVGLILSAAVISSTTSADPQSFTNLGSGVALFLPALIPLAVLAVPFVDFVLAVVRRVAGGRSPFAPDKRHLHHRLLELGHSHRRAVLLLYFWTALVASVGVAASYQQTGWIGIVAFVALVCLGVLLSVVPYLRGRWRGNV